MIIRPANRNDVASIFGLIQELALFEKAPNEVTNTPEQLAIDLFDDKICEALVLQEGEEVVGFALYYFSYSTWKGKCLYLEDFYIQPTFRNKGLGSQLFNAVVAIAKMHKVKRMDWQVLDWNHAAIAFYKKENAILDETWLNGRLFFE